MANRIARGSVSVFTKAYIAGLVCMVVMLSGCVTINRPPPRFVDDMPHLAGLCEVVDSKFLIKWVILVKEEEDEFPANSCVWIHAITYK